MVTKEKGSSRGRPRAFDRDEAIATGQRLIHERGYDGVSVAELTDAMGIRPPSFYAAFGSKAGLYDLVLERWHDSGAIPFVRILKAGRPVADALAELLEVAAELYARDDETRGCLVIEGTRSHDAPAREAACRRNRDAEDLIRRFVGAHRPELAGQVADFVSATLVGLSAKARQGHDRERLLAIAELASSAVRHALD